METSELHLAIQEEFNAKIKTLQRWLSELQIEQEKKSAEKQIDVLANERFTEMKERQDVQMEIQVTKIKEMNTNLQQLEDWSNESEQKESKPVEQVQSKAVDVGSLNHRVLELEGEVQNLKVDNEELQALLDEETIKINLENLNQQKSQEDLSTRLKQLMSKNTELTPQIEKKMCSESLKACFGESKNGFQKKNQMDFRKAKWNWEKSK